MKLLERCKKTAVLLLFAPGVWLVAVISMTAGLAVGTVRQLRDIWAADAAP